jgi:hypothetical protein
VDSIIERCDNPVGLLAGLVSFSCDEHDVPRVGMCYGPLNGLRAVADLVEFNAFTHGRSSAIEYSGTNPSRRLRPWVVVSDNDDVGVLRGYRAHS